MTCARVISPGPERGYCNKKLLPRSLVPHQMYFCGPDAVRTAKLAKRETKQDLANEKAMRTLKIKKGKAGDVTADDVAAIKVAKAGPSNRPLSTLPASGFEDRVA